MSAKDVCSSLMEVSFGLQSLSKTSTPILFFLSAPVFPVFLTILTITSWLYSFLSSRYFLLLNLIFSLSSLLIHFSFPPLFLLNHTISSLAAMRGFGRTKCLLPGVPFRGWLGRSRSSCRTVQLQWQYLPFDPAGEGKPASQRQYMISTTRAFASQGLASSSNF